MPNLLAITEAIPEPAFTASVHEHCGCVGHSYWTCSALSDALRRWQSAVPSRGLVKKGAVRSSVSVVLSAQAHLQKVHVNIFEC